MLLKGQHQGDASGPVAGTCNASNQQLWHPHKVLKVLCFGGSKAACKLPSMVATQIHLRFLYLNIISIPAAMRRARMVNMASPAALLLLQGLLWLYKPLAWLCPTHHSNPGPSPC